jgi:hypothetical protein
MSKLKIFLYHMAAFIIGSIGIAVYVFTRLAAPTGAAGLGGVVAMPAIILVYVAAFAIFCLISLTVWLLVAVIRARRRRAP